jgi:hypothetical protein
MHLDQSDMGQKQAYKEGGQEEAAALSGLASPSGDTVLDRYSNFQQDVPEWGQYSSGVPRLASDPLTLSDYLCWRNHSVATIV